MALISSDEKPRHIHHLHLEEFEAGKVHEAWLHIINNGIGEPVRIPLIIAKGTQAGPTLGLTAALHGNELNGIPLIHDLFAHLDLAQLKGSIIGVLTANIPALLLEQRKFNDGKDLNRIAPGRARGDRSQVYIHRFIERIVKRFDYLIDLHTASFGRVNSYYIRADMDDPTIARMTQLHYPEIILHNPPNDSTLRGSAENLGIKALTLELKDPHIIQEEVVDDSLKGVFNVLYDLKMLPGKLFEPNRPTLLCESSYWLYTDEGGILYVYPEVTDRVVKGQLIAEVKNIFGKTTKHYEAPEDGIVIGKSVNPINQTGSRILHLGLNPQAL